jgi:hypothetical protein
LSKKKDRAWFVCPRWAEFVAAHYAGDTEAGQSLKADAKVIAKLRSGTPVAKSTLLKMLRRFAQRHDLGASVDQLIVDTRSG